MIDGHSLKTIIFDMDGTLVSSLSTIMHCENEISLKYKNQPLTLEDVIANFGPPARTIITNITASLSKELQTRAVSDYYECYSKNAPSKVLVFPGVIPLLKRIRASSRHLALVTGVEKIMMQYTLDPFDLSRFFEARVTADDVRSGKPDPEGIILALKQVKVEAKESMYIGDSPVDILAGKRAGVWTGAALWSPENRGNPTTENPDREFRSVQQLSNFLFPKSRRDQEPYFGSDLPPTRDPQSKNPRVKVHTEKSNDGR